jgi:hypothetical protein
MTEEREMPPTRADLDRIRHEADRERIHARIEEMRRLLRGGDRQDQSSRT